MKRAYGLTCEAVRMVRGNVPFALSCAGDGKEADLVKVRVYTGADYQFVEITMAPTAARLLASHIWNAAALAERETVYVTATEEPE